MEGKFSLNDIVKRTYDSVGLWINYAKRDGQPLDYSVLIAEGSYESFSSGDEIEIKTHLGELLTNSLKAMLGVQQLNELMTRCGKFNVSTANGETPRMELNLSIQDNNYLLQVSDNGPGIPPEKLSIIWNRGFSTFGTSGLGLDIARDYFQSIGGDIEVESKSQIGTTVKVYIPKKKTHQ